MIELSHVSKWFGTHRQFRAVSDISLSIRKGQCVGLLGPNGAGKTTTIRMITGFIPPSEGSIRIGQTGTDPGFDTIIQSTQARNALGYLPESTPLFPEMRVVDYLQYRAGLYQLDRGQKRTGIAMSMDRCQLTNVQRRRIGQLSKGYKQRVGLAGALVHNPPVLILDEPTSGLDPSQIREARSLIKDLASERTVLVSSHILPEIQQTCDRVLIMAGGKVCADGTPEELIASHVGSGAVHVIEVPTSVLAKAQAILEGTELRARVEGAHADGQFQDAAWTRLLIRPRENLRDIREPLAEVFVQSNIPYRELSRRHTTLEQVFLNVIEAAGG